MSICHIKLEKHYEDGKLVIYKIFSSDFNDNYEWEGLGEISIDLEKNQFSHKDNDIWIRNKIYPIELFSLSVEERKAIIQKKYSDFGSGRWSMNIYRFINNCITSRSFPDNKLIIT